MSIWRGELCCWYAVASSVTAPASHHRKVTLRFRAPGRVNLIGEHTDYNDGYVLPAAIGFDTVATVSPAAKLELVSLNEAPVGWERYVLGVVEQLQKRGIAIPPVRLVFDSTVPIGAGLSSSAALEVSAALALLGAANRELSKIEIAQLCQQAEIETVGLACGIMDQFIALHGEANCAVLLDCRTMVSRPVRISKDIVLVIADTGVKHELATSEYNTRRRECEAAAVALGVASLRDATIWNGNKRARHVVTENARVLAFVEALETNERRVLGELMAASHASLRDDYEVSCSELDLMVDCAQRCPGLIGARMTGGGFGGSTINLVAAEHAEAFRERLAALYEAETGRAANILITNAAEGASALIAKTV